MKFEEGGYGVTGRFRDLAGAQSLGDPEQ